MSTTAILAVLAPADALRRALLHAMGPLARPFVRDREARVAVMGTVLVALSFATTLSLPLWSLALGPILLGVPHLLADVRYLWVRPGYHRRPSMWLALAAPLLLGTAVGNLFGGLAGAAGAVVVARASRGRRAVVLVAMAAVALATWRAGAFADILFAHAHNVLALALFWAWRPRATKLHFLPIAAFGLCSLLIAGDLVTPALRFAVDAGCPLPLRYHAHVLAPGVPALAAQRIVLLFAFAQSVHYAVWLRLVPEEDRPRATPRSFAASFRALADDFGPWPLVVTAFGALALAGWAVANLWAARSGYMRFSVFHAQLELAVAALWLTEGRRPAGVHDR